MFPLSLLQSSYSPLCVCREPALGLWPAQQLMFGLLEDNMLSMRSDIERRMQRVNQVYQLLAQDMERRADLKRNSAVTASNDSTTGKEGKKNFELTLDVSGFSPEELTVKTEGRRLIVSGKHDKKQETENGGYFHEYKEWKRETQLPEDVNPEEILCSLSDDGQLHFQAARLALPAAKERPIPINVSQNPKDEQENHLENQNSDLEGEKRLNSS